MRLPFYLGQHRAGPPNPMPLSPGFAEGLTLHWQGKLIVAGARYQAILKQNARHADFATGYLQAAEPCTGSAFAQ